MKYEFTNKVDFYITNVCNYTCDDCNRFNNHHFTGWQRWSDYADIYTEWSKRVKIESAVIMGGEPMLNPTLNNWIQGLFRTFDADVQVMTNGTRLLDVKGLYDTLLNNRAGYKQSHIGISIHNLDDFDEIRYNILNFLAKPSVEWGTLINKSAPENWNPRDTSYSASDDNGITINCFISNTFGKSAVIKNANGTFSLHNHDEDGARKAFQNCAFARFKSYHFIQGKLYRCGPVKLMQEFDQQHRFDLSDQDRKLLYSYQPLTIDNFDSYSQQFLNTIDDQIPQCKFCSNDTQYRQIYPIRKGL